MLAEYEMDRRTAKHCAAHFAVSWRGDAPKSANSAEDRARLLNAGRKIQRFWLSAAEQGLVMQPSLAPLCFAYYASEGVRFTDEEQPNAQAKSLENQVNSVFDGKAPMFFGRVGYPKQRSSIPRSIRKTLSELIGD